MSRISLPCALLLLLQHLAYADAHSPSGITGSSGILTQPLCYTEKRHDNGKYEFRTGSALSLEFPNILTGESSETLNDPIIVDKNGLVASLCGKHLNGDIKINDKIFVNQKVNNLRDNNFAGIRQTGHLENPKMDIMTLNIRHNNGQPLDEDYEDACSVTTSIKIANLENNDVNVESGSGVIFKSFTKENGSAHFAVHLTSDGNNTLNDSDTWVIFSDKTSSSSILVELLGFREGDFKDKLVMRLQGEGKADLFIGLEGTLELNNARSDFSKSYLNFTMTAFDTSSGAGFLNMLDNVRKCYDVADPWSRHFYRYSGGVAQVPSPEQALAFIAKSQCFSNSVSQQKWQIEDVGFWSINNNHGVQNNVIFPDNILPPYTQFELYVKKLEEPTFKGPRAYVYSDEKGALMTSLPTILEGDQILLRGLGQSFEVACVANPPSNL